MAGLHSVYLINVNQACPGHRALFPALFLEGQQEECWCQKRQARRTLGKRRGRRWPAARRWDSGAQGPDLRSWRRLLGGSAGERSFAGLHGWTFRGRGRSQSLTLWGPQRLFSVAFWSRGWGLAEAERDRSAPCMGNA